MPLITRKEAAKQLGVTIQSVYMSIKRGNLSIMHDKNGNVFVNSDTMREELGRKRVNKAITAITNKKQKDERIEKASKHGDFPEYEVSRARTEHLKAELLEIDKREKEAELVKADEVQQKWVQVITLARTKILGIPTKAKQRIPELDTTAITCLEDIVRETLEDLADRKAA